MINRPVRIISMARASPMRRRSRYVPPAPGMMARRLSGMPTVAAAEKTRKVEARASSRPPPSAMEDIAEMEGMGREERFLKV